MKKIIYLNAFLLLLFICSCGSTETKTISTTSVEMMEDFPIEGSNTLTGVWKADLSGTIIDNVKAAKVTAIKITMKEPATSDAIQEVIVQLAAKGAAMQRIGLLNPVQANEKQLNVSVASEQENLVDLLKQGDITIVADVNLKNDLPGPLTIAAEIEFELEVKK